MLFQTHMRMSLRLRVTNRVQESCFDISLSVVITNMNPYKVKGLL